ncbi:MAG: tetratricopeptide (TPR) repeat protein [Rhodothermales bacterium]|jgi:tetratricopeptide (TPR) repeat protein
MLRRLPLLFLATLVLAEDPPPAVQAETQLEAVREAIADRRIGDARGHLAKLIRVVDATPELEAPPQKLLAQADAEIAAGNPDKAHDLLRHLTRDAEFASDAFERLAQLHLQSNQLGQAMPYLQALAHREAGRPVIDRFVAGFDDERRTAVRIRLRSSQNHSPNGIGARYLLALVSADSRNLLSQLLRDLPDSPSVIDALVRALGTVDELAAVLPEHPENASLRQRTHLELARSRLAADLPADALAQLDALANITDHESGDSLLLRGDILLAMGKPGQASLIYARYFRHPDAQDATIPIFTRLARFFLDSIEWAQATHALEIAQRAWPEHSEFTHMLAEARLGAGAPAAALALIQTAEPSPGAFLLSARAQRDLGETEMAVQTLENGSKLHPGESAIAILLAELYIGRGQMDAASAALGEHTAPILQTLLAVHRGELDAASAANSAIPNPNVPLAKLATGRLLLAQARTAADAELADSADRVLAQADPQLAVQDRIAAAVLAAQLRTPQREEAAQPPWLPLILVLAALGVLAWWIFRQLDDFSVVEARLEEIEASARAFIRNASPGAEVDDVPLADLLADLLAVLESSEDSAPPNIVEQLASAVACQRVICELRKLPATDRIRFFRIARPIERQLQTILEELQLDPGALAATREQATLRV